MISIAAVPILLIVVLFVSPIIFFTDRGPVFYIAERVGQYGKAFKMIKFRSMRVNAPDLRRADGSTYNGNNDPRVTKIGKIIRVTSVDELPQIINVFLGQMSIVGPRPNLPTIPYSEMDFEHKHRLEVRPGLTGYNQAFYRNSVSIEEKLLNDNYYVDNMSLLLDGKIVLKTIETVVRRKNVYKN